MMTSAEIMAKYEADPSSTWWVWELHQIEYHNFLYVGFGRSDANAPDPLWRDLYDLMEVAEEKWIRAQPWPRFVSSEKQATSDFRPFLNRLGMVVRVHERQQSAWINWHGGGGNEWSKGAILWNQPSKELLEAHGIINKNVAP